MKQVSIIGIGWLGEQLGDFLAEKGFFISGSSTTNEKLKRLNEKFSSVSRFDLNQLKNDDSSLSGFDTAELFILTIPPSVSDDYTKLMAKLILQLGEKNKNATFIYTSSTSVYGSLNREVNELSTLHPETENAKKIVELEHFLKLRFPDQSIVLRLGGLVGKDRHPVKYLSGRENVSKGKAAVNLVHADDICNFVFSLIKLKINVGTYNLCSPEHPGKKKYYQWAAEQLNLKIPTFNLLDNQKDKVVNCNAIQPLGFRFKYQSPYDFPLGE